ncbi:MAG: IS3 family transposase [Mycobacteriaceae bacterium]|nr:IS3 family transposase [Mycobacteriaceae bacterium]
MKWLCAIVEVARSSFYAWWAAADHRAARKAADEALAERIRVVHGADNTYGAPRITAELNDGVAREDRVNHKRVARVMREAGIAGYRRKRRVKTTVPDPADQKVPDLFGRDFTAATANTKYVGDITYLPLATGGNLYLATVIDCFSRRVAGWAIADHMRTDLVADALIAADALRGGLAGAKFHSDHGSQGGFNWSSQHLVIVEVSGGSSTASSGPGNASEAQIARAPEVSASCRGGVLGADRQRASRRRSRGRCRRGAGGRGALVPQRWRHVTV